MKQSLYYECLFVFMILEVKNLKSDNNTQAPNSTWLQWNNPGGDYAQGYLDDPNNPPPGDRPPNTYGYNTDPNRYSKLPVWNSTGPQWNNPGGDYAQGYLNDPTNPPPGDRPPNTYGYNTDPNRYSKLPVWNSTSPQWNNPGSGVDYYQENNPKDIVRSSESPSRDESDVHIMNNYQVSTNNSTNVSMQHPGGNYHEGNEKTKNYTLQASDRLQNTSRNDSNFNEHNSNTATLNSTRPQENYLGSQHFAAPNDSMFPYYKIKRSVRRSKKTRCKTDQGRRRTNGLSVKLTISKWNCTNKAPRHRQRTTPVPPSPQHESPPRYIPPHGFPPQYIPSPQHGLTPQYIPRPQYEPHLQYIPSPQHGLPPQYIPPPQYGPPLQYIPSPQHGLPPQYIPPPQHGATPYYVPPHFGTSGSFKFQAHYGQQSHFGSQVGSQNNNGDGGQTINNIQFLSLPPNYYPVYHNIMTPSAGLNGYPSQSHNTYVLNGPYLGVTETGVKSTDWLTEDNIEGSGTDQSMSEIDDSLDQSYGGNVGDIFAGEI